MNIYKNKGQGIFALVYILLVLTTIVIALCHTWTNLLWYTFQGNIFALVVMIIDLGYFSKGKTLSHKFALTEFTALIAILTIGVIYCTLLGKFFSKGFWCDFQNLTFHFTSPILFAAYFFIYRRKEAPAIRQAPWCLIPPLAYICFVFVRNAILGIKWYPYFFVNIDKLGVWGFVKWVAIITICLLIVGYGILWICNSSKKKK